MTARVGASVALLAGILGGWFWGASGKSELARALRTAEARNELIEARSDLVRARAAVLGARVNLCEADYAGMGRQLEDARTLVDRAAARLGSPGGSDGPRGSSLGGFDEEIGRAQFLAASLDPSAGFSLQSARAHDVIWSGKTEWNTVTEVDRRSWATLRSCSASQAVQRTAKGSARSLCSEISPAHSAQ